MKPQKMDEPVSMFVLFARFFSILAKNLEKEFGAKGLEILKQSVIDWGVARGKDIARRAAQRGQKNDLAAYLPNYDMERSELFGYDTEYGKDEINQDFDRCVFAKTWMDAGEEKYGRIYCENIDPAICKGYNEDLECVHDHIMYKDHHCTFCFRMKKKD
ncbi:L-2-amino-thiazoline-4-carboxylic acid hydrolase [uncultured Acidaminococcus sp.]|uniref:L-2-amino-thiazoline-4-carboxylic acid hydrolase n=1 Tax=uncultured Acidaminococcus sp. TaxID=352152 RepID=UPI002638ED48|nr:L-2-amino-thiazoline-4-carboxylic acid hydrolase [uncultured Acidaminococcus sp.]